MGRYVVLETRWNGEREEEKWWVGVGVEKCVEMWKTWKKCGKVCGEVWD